MKVLGYFVDVDGDKTSPYDVYVAIDDLPAHEKVTMYCPIGQHQEGSREYMNGCNKITKEEYLKASQGLYTPLDYV
jgi:hypothetical protein